MSERAATALIFVVGLAFEVVAVLGLSALGANPATVYLGFFVPLALGAYAISRVTMHFSARDRRND